MTNPESCQDGWPWRFLAGRDCSVQLIGTLKPGDDPHCACAADRLTG
jgi:hypothetical protein